MRTTPRSVLLDAVTATAFQAHPYRNNTIGYESDVAALTLEDAQAFYEQPLRARPTRCWRSSAMSSRPRRKALVAQHFRRAAARGPRRSATAARRTAAARRAADDLLNGPVDRQHFAIAFPAPAASSPDFAAFLVLQQLLSGGSGVNFRQNDWGTPADAGIAAARRHRGPRDLVHPDRRPLHLHHQGLARAGRDRAALEQELERRIASLRSSAPTAGATDGCKAAVARQLVEDVETHRGRRAPARLFRGIGALRHAARPARARRGGHRRADSRGSRRPISRRNSARSAGIVPGQPPAANGLGAGRAAPGADARGRPPRTPSARPRPSFAGCPAACRRSSRPSPLSPTVTVELLLSAPVERRRAAARPAGARRRHPLGPAGGPRALIADARRRRSRERRSPQARPPATTRKRGSQQMIAGEMRLRRQRPAQPAGASSSAARSTRQRRSTSLERRSANFGPAHPCRRARLARGTGTEQSSRIATPARAGRARLCRRRAAAGNARRPRLADAAVHPHPRLFRPPRPLGDRRQGPRLPHRQRLPDRRPPRLGDAIDRRRPGQGRRARSGAQAPSSQRLAIEPADAPPKSRRRAGICSAATSAARRATTKSPTSWLRNFVETGGLRSHMPS